MLAEELKFATI